MSGVGHVLLETLHALDHDKYRDIFDIKIFVPWDEKKNISRYSFKNISVVLLPMPHKLFSLLSRLPFGIPLDLLLGRGVYIFPNFRNWNLLSSYSITYIHDVCFRIYPQYVEERNRKYLTKYINMWVRRTDRIIAVSDASKREVQETLKIDPEHVSVVRNAVDKTIFYKRSSEEVALIRKKYGLTKDYFLYLGNIEPRKNLTTLISAFRRPELRDHSQLFLVGGDGWLNENVYSAIETAKTEGYTIIKNKSYVPDEDIPALMTGAIALVQPSWHEGFGLPTVQALACGTPNICSDIPSLREATEGNQDLVTFFNPSDSSELARILVDNLHSSVTHISSEVGTWEESIKSLVEVINKGDK